MSTLYLTIKDPGFTKMTDYEKNILKWAALLHAISKRSSPFFESRDHIHPFISGGTALVVFAQLGILKLNLE